MCLCLIICFLCLVRWEELIWFILISDFDFLLGKVDVFLNLIILLCVWFEVVGDWCVVVKLWFLLFNLVNCFGVL